jgi:hypothetical protein
MKPKVAGIVGLLVLCAASVIIGIQAWKTGRLMYDIYYGEGIRILISPFWIVQRGLNTAFAFYGALVAHRALRNLPTRYIWLGGFVALLIPYLFTRPMFVIPSYIGIHLIAIVCLIIRDIRRVASIWSRDESPRETA